MRSIAMIPVLLVLMTGAVRADFPAGPETLGGVATVQVTRIEPMVSLGATVVPYKEVALSAQVPGRVEYIAGSEGDRFSKGALLVKINEDELLAQRRAALAALDSAEASLRNAGVQYNRELYAPQSRSSPGGMGMPSLFDQMFSKPMGKALGGNDPYVERRADLYSSGARLEQARNAILAAQSKLQAIDAKLRDTRSLAPMDGMIIKKFVEVGDSVQPGNPLLKFADIEYLQVQVEVPARLMPGLREGMVVSAILDVHKTQVPARVAQVFPMADPDRHTVTVKFDLPKGSPAAPGMYAEIRIPDVEAPVRNLPVVPLSAVRWRGSLPGVYVMNEQNRPELRLVRVGNPLNSTHVTVLSGLKAGDRILVNPPANLSSGWAGRPQGG